MARFDRLRNNARKKAKSFTSETKKRIATAITAGFALVIALTWNDMIQGLVDGIMKWFDWGISAGVLGKLIAALLTTVICVVGIVYFSRWGE